MPVAIGEELRHFGDEPVEKAIGLLASGIEGGREDAEAALDRIGPRRAGIPGIPDEPRGRVARHVELRHYPDAPVAGVGDDLANLLLGIKETVGALALETGKAAALHPESLVL